MILIYREETHMGKGRKNLEIKMKRKTNQKKKKLRIKKRIAESKKV